MSKTPNRRHFIKTASVAALGAASVARASTSPNEKIIVGIIGTGGRGSGLADTMARHPDAEVAFVCDVDQDRARACAARVEKAGGKAPRIESDLRKVLDHKDVDAVVVATPDHWHAPATILACAAGKHVYVEKPCSHNIREGRLMLEAARKHNKVVQVGTQARNTVHVQKAMELLKSGAIGEVLMAKAWDTQRRKDIGKGSPGAAPANLDYDLWVGPAPMVPYQSNLLHYNWHWRYAFGTGDMGNDGAHEMDLALWGLGVETHPSTVSAIGGKLFFDDDQEFPDSQTAVFDFPATGPNGKRKQMIFELRIWTPYDQEGYDNGNAFYGTKGMLLLGKNESYRLYGEGNKLIEEVKLSEATPASGPSGTTAAQQRDFLDCIRSGARPKADIEIGHRAATACHLANIASRLNRTLQFDPEKEQIIGDDEANALVGRTYREGGHWAIPA